jgi:transposase
MNASHIRVDEIFAVIRVDEIFAVRGECHAVDRSIGAIARHTHRHQFRELCVRDACGGRVLSKRLQRSAGRAIFYLLRTGCQWRLLPREFPIWGTVYHYFRHGERGRMDVFAASHLRANSKESGPICVSFGGDHRRTIGKNKRKRPTNPSMRVSLERRIVVG